MQIKNNVEDFISRWQGSTASELATAQSFVINLCELLGVDKPHATADLDAIAAHFKARGRWRDRLPTILEALVAIGRVRKAEDEKWVA